MADTALITGASGGLGGEFAELFAADGYDLVLTARSVDKLETLKKDIEAKHRVRVTVLPADLSRIGAPASLVEELARHGLTVDILVNNAGFGAYGFFHQTDYKEERDLLQVNVAALTELTKLLVPAMVKQGRGRILNVASVAAFPPGPLMAVYYASKAYVLSLSVALANELAVTGVTVTCLCPGPTKTGFATGAHMGKSKLFRGRLLDPRRVARDGYRGCMRGTQIVIPGWWHKLMAFGTRIVSRPFAASVARRAQNPA